MANVVLNTDTGEIVDALTSSGQFPVTNVGQDPEQFFGVWQNYAYNQMIEMVFKFWLDGVEDLFKAI